VVYTTEVDTVGADCGVGEFLRRNLKNNDTPGAVTSIVTSELKLNCKVPLVRFQRAGLTMPAVDELSRVTFESGLMDASLILPVNPTSRILGEQMV
jgi:hypothetical protein